MLNISKADWTTFEQQKTWTQLNIDKKTQEPQTHAKLKYAYNILNKDEKLNIQEQLATQSRCNLEEYVRQIKKQGHLRAI